MNSFYKKFSGRTYIKYFLSYLIIVTVLILGFFLIIRSQLTKHSFNQQSEQSKAQMDNIAEQLNDDLIYLSQVDTSLRNNVELIMSRHKKESTYRYQIFNELNKYSSCSQLIRSIVYVPAKNADVISTQILVTYEKGIFYIKETLANDLAFDPAPYIDASYGQLIFVCNGPQEYLLYFPATSSNSNYMFFYILDTSGIQQQLKGLTSNEMPAIALIDSNKQFVTDVNASQLAPYVESLELENGIYKLDASTSICVHTGINRGFSMIALLSNDSLSRQINATFASSYMALMLLSVIGFLLILLAMRITYMPLHQLTQKIVSNSNSNSKQGFLEQLDQAFSDAAEQNQLLKEKLDNYRLSIQKSLLDSVVTAQRGSKTASFPNIDQFFNTSSGNEIYAVQMSAPGHRLPAAEILTYFQTVLPGKDACILLDTRSDSSIFLINYSGYEQNKNEVLIELLNNFYEEKGYLSAISNGTSSALDIPSLYENVIHASEYWDSIPVVDFKSLPPTRVTFAYPSESLNQFSEHLKKYQFAEAKALVNELFLVIDNALLTSNSLPDFFIRCILVDILTLIINSMNESYITFKTYCNLYYETLYLCRSCPYDEKAGEIKANTDKLIHLYEQEIYNITLDSAHIKQLIDILYCQPDFSISVLADKFHVSIAYMSYLVKKELNQNFSDYLWQLRLQKAKELLLTSNMSIDEISVAVGYFNTSSFRRKFKQETGITPSQFRSREEYVK